MDDIFKFNVSGRCFQVSKTILKQFPNSTLYRLAQQSNCSDDVFLDRPSAIFEAILSLYQTNELHMPSNVCPATFKTELDFWGVSPDVLEICCRRKYLKFIREQSELEKFEKFTNTKENVKEPTGGCAKWKYRIWLILNNPFSSIAAKVYFVIASIMVVTSTFLVIANSLPLFQREMTSDDWRKYFSDDWSNHEDDVNEWLYNDEEDANETLIPKDTLKKFKAVSTVYEPIIHMTYFCVVFFTVELCVRLFVCPSVRKFFKCILNVVDTLAVVVSVVEVIANLAISTEKYETTYVDVISCFQILRVLRLYRLTSHVTGARILMYAIKISFNELIFMALLLTINTIIFGTVAFYADQDKMGDILTACWWAVITMTTVGYGDIYPTTAVGKLVGVLCASMGIMVIAITVPLFVNNFITYYIYADETPTAPCDKNKKVAETKCFKMKDNQVHMEDPFSEKDISLSY